MKTMKPKKLSHMDSITVNTSSMVLEERSECGQNVLLTSGKVTSKMVNLMISEDGSLFIGAVTNLTRSSMASSLLT